MPGNCIVAALVAWALAPTRTRIRRMRNRVGRWHWYWVRDGQAWEFHAPCRSRLPYWRNALYLGVPRRMGGRADG